MKFVILDIETSNLNADFGFIICAVLKEYGAKEPRIFRIDNYKGWNTAKYNDKEMVKDIVRELQKYDGIVTYNGRNFDIPFLRSQIIAYDLEHLPSLFHIDVYYATKYRLKLHNSKLNTLITFLNTYRAGKKRIEEKTAINSLYYKQAITGDKKGINQLVHHCIKDVIALEQCYNYLKSEVKSITRSL